MLWFAADRGVTESGGLVSKWLDQSGNHHDASQVATSARPLLVPAAENGLPMLEFDGVDDSLALAQGFQDFSQGLSFFAVAHVLEGSECQSVMQFSNGAEMDDIDFGRYQGSIHYEVSEEYVTGPPDAFTVDQTLLVDYVHDAEGLAEVRIDGQFMNSGNLMLPRVTLRAGNFVGRSLYANCQPLHARIGEILMYARPLSSDDRVKVEQYLGDKWGCCGI